MSAVRFAGVSKRFGAKRVLDRLSFEVARSETLVLVGRSGVGKSVTLRLILGLLKPDAGQVWVGDVEVSRLGERELVPVRRRIGMVFQGSALFDSLTVEDNVAYALRETQGWPADRIRRRVAECLALVDLEGTQSMLPEQLSGGMKKRVAIARAIATEPELMLYDEPTAGLDPATGDRVAELIAGLARRLGVTSVAVTHDMALAFTVADRLALLADARLAWIGPAEEARRQPPPALLAFMGKEHRAWTPPAGSP